jgi:flagellar motor component MotA
MPPGPHFPVFLGRQVSAEQVKRRRNGMSGVLGMVVVVGLIVPAIWLGGGGFWNVPSLILCICLPIGLGLASAGWSDLWRAVGSLRHLFTRPKDSDLSIRNVRVLRHMITYAYAAGVIGTAIGWIQSLSHFSGTSYIPAGLSISLLTMFYAIIIAECVLRPTARRIEWEWEKRDYQSRHSCDKVLRDALDHAHESHCSACDSGQR